MKSPLEGIKVIDLSFWNFVPSAAVVLGDYGADVIHIEPLEGDPMRGALLSLTTSTGIALPSPINYGFELSNRNKRSLAVDLKQETGRQIIYKLAETTDVFVTSHRNSSLKKLKMDYETIAKINPRIIYAHGSGFGEKGVNSERGGYDYGAFWARTGLMASHGEPDQPPPFGRPATGDQTSGMILAGGIALALLGRERFGIGQEVFTSLFACGLWMGSMQVQSVLSGAADVPRLSRKNVSNPLYNSYEAKDGKWFVLFSLVSDTGWSDVCNAIERPDLEHEPRFDSHEKRMKNNVALISILSEVFAARTRDEWAQRFNRTDVFWAPAQTYAEVINDPVAVDNQYIVEVDHPGRGKVKLVASPIQLGKTPPKIRRVAPELGQHNEEILLEMGYTWDDIAKFKADRVIL